MKLDRDGLMAAVKAAIPCNKRFDLSATVEAAIRAYLSAAPSPSHAPGVVTDEKRFPDPGDKMIFLNRHGYDNERERAREVFDSTKEYTVRARSIGSWSTTLYFDGVDGGWNSVMFGFASLSQPAKEANRHD